MWYILLSKWHSPGLLTTSPCFQRKSNPERVRKMEKKVLVSSFTLLFIAAIGATFLFCGQPLPTAEIGTAPVRVVPQAAPVEAPHERVTILNRSFASVEADLMTKELIFTNKLRPSRGVHVTMWYPVPGRPGEMKMDYFWFYRHGKREPLPRGLSLVALRKHEEGEQLGIAFFQLLEDDLCVKVLE